MMMMTTNFTADGEEGATLLSILEPSTYITQHVIDDNNDDQ